MVKTIASILFVIHCSLLVAQQATNATEKNPPRQENPSPQKLDVGDTGAPTQRLNHSTQTSIVDSQRKTATTESALGMAKTGTSTERVRAVDMLGESRSAKAIPDLSSILLKDNDANLRAHSAISLGYIADPRSVPALLDALSNDPETTVSVSAAEALGRIGGTQAQAALLQESRAARPLEVRSAAVRALGSVKTDDSAEALRDYTHDPVPEVRYAAVDGLVKQQSLQTTAPIVDLLYDNNANVAQRAAWALGELRDKTAIAPLTETLQSKGPVAVRRSSAFALGRIADPRVASVLNHVALDSMEEISVRAASVQALGILGNAEGNTTFRQLLSANHSILRTLAAFYSCQLHIVNNIGPVADLLSRVDAEEKKALISAMGFWPEPYADRLTKFVNDRSEDSETKALALSALYELPQDTKQSLADRLAPALRPNDEVDVQLALIEFLAEVPSPSVHSALTRFATVQGLDPKVKARLEAVLAAN